MASKDKIIETIKSIPYLIIILSTEAIIKLIMYIIIGLFWIIRLIITGITSIIRIIFATILSLIIKIIMLIKRNKKI
ncbi:MAG: hypothetical protein ACRC1M_05865 [Methanobacteriaceae archaeon]